MTGLKKAGNTLLVIEVKKSWLNWTNRNAKSQGYTRMSHVYEEKIVAVLWLLFAWLKVFSNLWNYVFSSIPGQASSIMYIFYLSGSATVKPVSGNFLLLHLNFCHLFSHESIWKEGHVLYDVWLASSETYESSIDISIKVKVYYSTCALDPCL